MNFPPPPANPMTGSYNPLLTPIMSAFTPPKSPLQFRDLGNRIQGGQQQMMSQMAQGGPQTVGGGIGALAQGIALNAMRRNMNSQFPTAPTTPGQSGGGMFGGAGNFFGGLMGFGSRRGGLF